MKISIDKKEQVLIFCSLLFMGTLVVADFTSVKMAGFNLFGVLFLVPMGTFAFALTFYATDIIGELYDRKKAVFVVWAGVALRFLLMLYIIWSIGNDEGTVALFSPTNAWTSQMQDHYNFVFSGSISIYIAGFVAIIIASLLDVYIFHYFKEKHKDKNMFWFRNTISTMLGQMINSSLFVTIAFINFLTIKELLLAIGGQIIIKWIIAIFIDTPFAYALRNYGQNKKDWYKIWDIKKFFSN